MTRGMPLPIVGLLALALELPLVLSLRAQSAAASDELLDAARACDADAARLLLYGGDVDPDVFSVPGAGAVAGVQAALYAGCGEVVALIMLHPAFNHSGLTQEALRELRLHAPKDPESDWKAITWAFTLAEQFLARAPQQQESAPDPGSATRRQLWPLPAPGDWPAALGPDLGISLPVKPALPTRVLEDFVTTTEFECLRHRVAHTKCPLDGTRLWVDKVEHLWYLLVGMLQTPDDSPRADAIEQQIRSVGWGLFFRGSTGAMLLHCEVVKVLAGSLVQVPPMQDARHAHLAGTGASDLLEDYRGLGRYLDIIWHGVGEWLA